MTDSAGVVLDAGPFIAVERGAPRAIRLVRGFAHAGTPLVTSAGVVAQIWRGGTGRQVPVALLLRCVEVVDLTHAAARTLGLILGRSGRADPIDAHLALLAHDRGWPVLTSDADDLLAIDPTLTVERI